MSFPDYSAPVSARGALATAVPVPPAAGAPDGPVRGGPILETLQVMKYAARALQVGQYYTGDSLEEPLLRRLDQVVSNLPAKGNGRQLSICVLPEGPQTIPYLAT